MTRLQYILALCGFWAVMASTIACVVAAGIAVVTGDNDLAFWAGCGIGIGILTLIRLDRLAGENE